MMRAVMLSIGVLAASIAAACNGGDAATPTSPDAGTTPTKSPGPTYEEPDTGVGPTCVPMQSGAAETAKVPMPYAGMTNPYADDVAGGAVVYREQCLRCHGENGVPSGGELHPAPPDFTKRSFASDYMFWRVTKGGNGDPICSDMPSFEMLLGDASRWRAVAYIQSLAPAPMSDAGTD